jgi:hypothetical protein
MEISKKNMWLEIFGWYGTVGVIAAYALISLHVFDSFSLWYQLLNLTASAGVCSISFYKKAYQPAVLNLIWFVIAAIGLIQIMLK